MCVCVCVYVCMCVCVYVCARALKIFSRDQSNRSVRHLYFFVNMQNLFCVKFPFELRQLRHSKHPPFFFSFQWMFFSPEKLSIVLRKLIGRKKRRYSIDSNRIKYKYRDNKRAQNCQPLGQYFVQLELLIVYLLFFSLQIDIHLKLIVNLQQTEESIS